MWDSFQAKAAAWYGLNNRKPIEWMRLEHTGATKIEEKEELNWLHFKANQSSLKYDPTGVSLKDNG